MKPIAKTSLVMFLICLSANTLFAQDAHAAHETNVYTYLAPLTLLLIASELIYLAATRKKLLTFQEAIANLGTALGNQTMNVLIAAGVYVIYGYLWTNFRICAINLN